MKFRLLHTSRWRPAAIADALAADQVEAEELREPFSTPLNTIPTVLVLDPGSRQEIPGAVLHPGAAEPAGAVYTIRF